MNVDNFGQSNFESLWWIVRAMTITISQNKRTWHSYSLNSLHTLTEWLRCFRSWLPNIRKPRKPSVSQRDISVGDRWIDIFSRDAISWLHWPRMKRYSKPTGSFLHSLPQWLHLISLPLIRTLFPPYVVVYSKSHSSSSKGTMRTFISPHFPRDSICLKSHSRRLSRDHHLCLRRTTGIRGISRTFILLFNKSRRTSASFLPSANLGDMLSCVNKISIGSRYLIVSPVDAILRCVN